MKKVCKFFGSVSLMMTLMLGVVSVNAIESDKINFSNKISLPFIVFNGNIDVRLSNKLKANNSSIKYQFVSTTEEVINTVTASLSTADDNYDTCVASAKKQYPYESMSDENYNKYVTASNTCVNTYNSALAKAYEPMPGYDDSKWKEMSISEEDANYLTYSLKDPADSQYYVLWLNAKDEDNKDIYNMMYRKSLSYVEPEENEKEEEKTPVVEEETKEEEKTPVVEEETKEEEIPVVEEEPVEDEFLEDEFVEEDNEEVVENPPTGLYISVGVIVATILGLFGFVTLRKKNYFSKI